MKLEKTALVLALAVGAGCDESKSNKDEPEAPLVEGKADRYQTDFVHAGALAPGAPALRGAITEVDRFLGYTFYGRAGDSVSVALDNAAAGLDTVLWIYGPYDPDTGRWSAKPLAMNDDRDGELSAIELALPSDGMYLAIVTSYEQRTQGAFDIALACSGCSSAPRPGELVVSEVHARPTGDATVSDANGDGMVNDFDELVELRNVSRVPIELAGVELAAGGATVHQLALTGLLAPGQAVLVLGGTPCADVTFPVRFEVAVDGSLALPDDGATLAVRRGGEVLDEIVYPASTLDGSLVRVDTGEGVSFQPHLDVTQGARAMSPGTTIDGSPFPNPNTSTRIDVSDGEDAVEDARLDAQAALAAKLGKVVPVTVSRTSFLGPKLEDRDIEAGIRRLIAALPQLRHPDTTITRVTFGGSDARRYGTSVHLDVHDDGRQAFRVLSTNLADEPAHAAFRAEADAAFAAELPLVHRIEQRLLPWLANPANDPGTALAAAGVSVTNVKRETRIYGSMNEYRYDTITIDLSSSYPKQIRVTVYYAKSSTTVDRYSISYSQPGLPLLQNTVRSLTLEGDRTMDYAQNYVHDTSTGKLQRRTFLDHDGNVERVVRINTPMLPRDQIAIDTSDPLDPIYAGLVQRSPARGQTVVGILDSGMDYNHPALVHKLHENTADGEATDGVDGDLNGKADDFLGWDFDDDDRLPYDYNDFLLNFSQSFDHGTHVGGIAAQGTEDVRLVPVRWKINGAALAASVDYMSGRGARVVNMSFSSTSRYTMDPLGAKIAARPEMLFVAAAGNDGEDLETKPRYPASWAYPNLITVAAVDDKGALTSWSNYGAVSVDLAAPGDAILNTVVGGGWGTKSGTSMATPYVVNVAAKMLALAPGLTPVQIKSILMQTVDVRADFAGKVVSQGVVNAARAMRVAWLWQRVKDGQPSSIIGELGLADAEANRIVSLALAL